MNTKQPESLRIADDLRHSIAHYGREDAFTLNAYEAEKRLRGLHSESETLRAGYDAARLEIASLQAQLEAVGAAPAKVLAGVIELAKAAHAHWDADRDAKVGKILMAMAGWNEGYDWRADALHAAATTPQPAAQALDAARVFWQQHTQADALSMTMAELHSDVELVIRATSKQPAAKALDAAPWRPIATAPKDGEAVILTEGGKVFHGGFITVDFKEIRDGDGNYIDQIDPDEYWMNFDDGDVCTPTHWMPKRSLPAPPTAAIAAKQGGANG